MSLTSSLTSVPLLVGPALRPLPSPEIIRRLRQVDERFDLIAPTDGRPAWWIIRRWAESDARWAMVQRQEMARTDAWDLFIEIPQDCPVEQVPSYLERLAYTAGRQTVREALQDLWKFNAAQKALNADRALEDVKNEAEVRKERLFNTPKVYNAGLPGAPGLPGLDAPAPDAPKRKRGR